MRYKMVLVDTSSVEGVVLTWDEHNSAFKDLEGGSAFRRTVYYVNADTNEHVPASDPDLALYKKITGLGRSVRYREPGYRHHSPGFIMEVASEYIMISTRPNLRIPLEEFWETYEL